MQDAHKKTKLELEDARFALQEKSVELQAKNQETKKMEQMFAEYAQWRSKLEEIEQKMKKEVTFWREQSN